MTYQYPKTHCEGCGEIHYYLTMEEQELLWKVAEIGGMQNPVWKVLKSNSDRNACVAKVASRHLALVEGTEEVRERCISTQQKELVVLREQQKKALELLAWAEGTAEVRERCISTQQKELVVLREQHKLAMELHKKYEALQKDHDELQRNVAEYVGTRDNELRAEEEKSKALDAKLKAITRLVPEAISQLEAMSIHDNYNNVASQPPTGRKLRCILCYKDRIVCDGSVQCGHCTEANSRCVYQQCQAHHNYVHGCTRKNCNLVHNEEGYDCGDAGMAMSIGKEKVLH
ncbi:hypothetical protein BU16DRAFT_566327 [Lophium mytilinum]|uniref:Uncharacterized protein n=1 Tax=Lophium mytilinum TaxID=390894 RepID=A0A6A6QD24_9PEZI|nr:hypothetical protein BU16DRAFT_566327 [Lophium mytilinum]